MGAAVGDCNGDGLPDLLVTRFGNASLYINSSKGLFDDRIAASGILNVSARMSGGAAASLTSTMTATWMSSSPTAARIS